MLSRRDFHKQAMAVLASSLALPATANATQTDRFLSRLTFGPTDLSKAQFDQLGLERWLGEQLSFDGDDAALETRLRSAQLEIEYDAESDQNGNSWPATKENRPYAMLDQSPHDLLQMADYSNGMAWEERLRPAREVIAASLIRAVHSKAQLHEIMVQFWHDHFSVNAFNDEVTAAFFPLHDAAIRAHSLGNFRALLGSMARSPSMLWYLDNAQSRASPANENYAREILELHTMGAEHYLNDRHQGWETVPGAKIGQPEGYIDQDVYEAARAFTGWTIAQGQSLGEGRHAPYTGEFFYAQNWHDPYQKRVLAREFAPYRAPLADGEEVLDILAEHPATARFVSRKIIRRLGLEAPSEDLLSKAAKIFRSQWRAPDQIAQVIRAIVLDPEFAATPPHKLRRPFEFLAAIYRATGAEITGPSKSFAWALGRAGWTQHRVRPPTGHSDKSTDWVNTRVLNGLIYLALNCHQDWLGAVQSAAHLDKPLGNATTWGEHCEAWCARLGAPSSCARDFLASEDIDPTAPLPTDNPNGVAWAARSVIALSSLTQPMLFR